MSKKVMKDNEKPSLKNDEDEGTKVKEIRKQKSNKNLINRQDPAEPWYFTHI